MTTAPSPRLTLSPRIIGEGEMANAIRDFDWQTTPLGPMESWPPLLISTVNLILSLPNPSLLLWGPQMVMLYNDAFTPILTDRHPALGRLGRDFWTDVWPAVGEQLESVLRDGVTIQFEKALVPILRNGVLTDTWFDYTYSPIFDSAGNICGVLDLCLDVTSSVLGERQRTAVEEALRQRQAALDLTIVALHAERTRLLNILQQSPIFFALLQGPDHIFTMANPLYEKLIAHREILGLSIEEALPEVVGQGYIELLDGVYNTGEPVVLHGAAVDLISHEGHPPERRILDFAYQPLREQDGSISGVIVLGVDITESKRAEKALLQNEKLAAVGRLASTIAHEINNPLEAVTNLVYLARNAGQTPSVQEYLALAELELRRMSAITRQTLAFNRQAAVPRAVTCEELIGTVVAIYESRITNAGIRVEKRKRATRSVLCMDGEIRQVLNNLVANAIDAMPHSGCLILRSRDATHPITGEQGFVLTVADNGAGIPPDSLRRIFEPFYTTKGLGGTGLGLWLSRDIVQRHRGDLRVYSSVHPNRHGTVFTLFLPSDGPGPEPAQ